jgi:hypothetical protein
MGQEATGLTMLRIGQKTMDARGTCTLPFFSSTESQMSANDSLYLRQARRHMDDLERESSVMRDHKEAMDCLDCDAFIQMIVDAFGWINKADCAYRKSLYDSQAECRDEVAEEVEKILSVLMNALIRPCEIADKWISQVYKRGYHLDNLVEFRKCEIEVRAIVRFHNSSTDRMLPDAIRAGRDIALDEHRNGKTAEFVSEEE